LVIEDPAFMVWIARVQVSFRHIELVGNIALRIELVAERGH